MTLPLDTTEIATLSQLYDMGPSWSLAQATERELAVRTSEGYWRALPWKDGQSPFESAPTYDQLIGIFAGYTRFVHEKGAAWLQSTETQDLFVFLNPYLRTGERTQRAAPIARTRNQGTTSVPGPAGPSVSGVDEQARSAAQRAQATADENTSFLRTFGARVTEVIRSVVPAWALMANPPSPTDPLPEYSAAQTVVLKARNALRFWEGINEVPDTPGTSSAVGHALIVTGENDTDYAFREVIDHEARSNAGDAISSIATTDQALAALTRAVDGEKTDRASGDSILDTRITDVQTNLQRQINFVYDSDSQFITVEPNSVVKTQAGVTIPYTVVLHGISTDEAGYGTIINVRFRLNGATRTAWIESWRVSSTKRVFTITPDSTVASNVINNIGTRDALTLTMEFLDGNGTVARFFDFTLPFAAAPSGPAPATSVRTARFKAPLNASSATNSLRVPFAAEGTLPTGFSYAVEDRTSPTITMPAGRWRFTLNIAPRYNFSGGQDLTGTPASIAAQMRVYPDPDNPSTSRTVMYQSEMANDLDKRTFLSLTGEAILTEVTRVRVFINGSGSRSPLFTGLDDDVENVLSITEF